MKYEEESSNVKNMKNMKRLVISRHSASPQDPQVPFTTSKPLKILKALYMVPDHCHDTGGVIADCIMKGYIDLPHYFSHFAVLSRARRPFYVILYIYILIYIFNIFPRNFCMTTAWHIPGCSKAAMSGAAVARSCYKRKRTVSASWKLSTTRPPDARILQYLDVLYDLVFSCCFF